MRLHVNKRQGLLEKHDQHPRWGPVLREPVLRHVNFLREDERRVLKTCLSVKGAAWTYLLPGGTGKGESGFRRL